MKILNELLKEHENATLRAYSKSKTPKLRSQIKKPPKVPTMPKTSVASGPPAPTPLKVSDRMPKMAPTHGRKP